MTSHLYQEPHKQFKEPHKQFRKPRKIKSRTIEVVNQFRKHYSTLKLFLEKIYSNKTPKEKKMK